MSKSEDNNLIENNDNIASSQVESNVKSTKKTTESVAQNKQETKVNSGITDYIVNKQVIYKEKPKLVHKKDDDIEEFDTSEEEDEEKLESKSNYSDHLSYEGDKCIYTEPETGRKLVWSSTENKWCPVEQSQSNDPTKNYKYDGKNYVYTDKTTDITYKFIQEKNEWVVKNDDENEDKCDKSEKDSVPPQPVSDAIYGFENDTHTYTDPNDGTSYFWDREKNAWFPKVDDEFMARYQMSYGFVDSSDTTKENTPKTIPKSAETQPPKPKLSKEEKKAENKRKNQEPATWFDVDQAHNTTIYIDNLPLDMTMEELKELVTKCGLLARDEKGKDKLKLYVTQEGENKGDARCTYIKVESVNLALDILDGWKIRDRTLSVQRAKFQQKGDYNPALKPKKRKKDKEKQKKIHEKLFDWRPERMRGEPLKCEKVVIIKNLFKPEDFDKDVTLLLEYQQDVREECKKCGEVKKVTIYDRHPEGVAQVSFKEVEEAQKCIELLNGRWFGQRRITAETWDGRTRYKIKETEEQIEARINNWDKYLEDKEEAEEKSEKGEKAKENPQQVSTTEENSQQVSTATENAQQASNAEENFQQQSIAGEMSQKASTAKVV